MSESSPVIVVDDSLPPGLAANAAAVLALTLGARVPGLVGAELVDADDQRHPGLIPIGLPVLRAPRDRLAGLRASAGAAGVEVIGFPAVGQQTNDYDEVRRHVAETPAAALDFLGLALYGSKQAVRRLTGSLPLLR
jgi:hypothetical protein